MRATETQSYTWSATGAGATFALTGGLYMTAAHSANWNSGNVALQVLGPDGSTWIGATNGSLSADGTLTASLAPGSYRFNVTTTAAGAVAVTRIPGD